MATKRDFAAMERHRASSGDSAAREALRSRMGHPTKLPLNELQANPQNPRYDYEDPETKELADTLARVGQLQPALVVERSQYISAYPDIELGPEPWVVIVGNRRLAASRLAERPMLDVRVAADLATPHEFEDRILIENLQRKDLPPLLEAAALERRLRQPGQTTRSVGEAIGRSHAYVQQRVDLLRMLPEFQALLKAEQLTFKLGRQLAVLPAETQREIFASGPPYVLPNRKPPKGAPTTLPDVEIGSDDAPSGNPVSNDQLPAEAASAQVGGPAGTTPLPPSPSTDSTDERHSLPDAAADSGNPVSIQEAPTAPTPPGSPNVEAAGERATNGRRTPVAPKPLDVGQTSTAVRQALDTAVAVLDQILPNGADGSALSALTDARRLIEEARAAINRVSGH